MIHKINIENILFLDIETVPQYCSFADVPEEVRLLFEDKTRYQRKDEIDASDFYERAGIWAEFGRIICISVGYFVSGTNRQFRLTNFQGDEIKILNSFKNLLESYFDHPDILLCAHNGKEFDFPYLARRMIINGIKLPSKLDLFGKKPWEVPHLDTMELWKFGDYKHFTSLKLLAMVLGIPSPKDDIDGSRVRDVYYQEDGLSRIAEYCNKDVITIAQILLKLRQDPLLHPSEIVIR